MLRLVRRSWSSLLGGSLVAILAAGCLVSSAAAQSRATLRVLAMTAEDGGALQGANVILNATGEQVPSQYAGATNADGFVELSGVVPGPYALSVSFVGFETQRDTLTLGEGERRTVRVSLPVREQTLGEVTVEAQRGAAKREAGLQVATAADVARIPVPGASGDLASYLQTLPGVVSVGDRGGQLFIRGGTPSQNLTLVDGQQIIQPFHISSLYSAFPQEVVRSADVYAGGFSTQYMNAVSSVIDVKLRRGNLKRYSGSVSASPYLVAAHAEGPIKEDEQSFLVSVRRSIVDDVDQSLYGRPIPLRFYDMTGRYSLQTNSVSCNVTGMHTSDDGQVNEERDALLSWTNTTVGGRCLLFGGGLSHAVEANVGYTSYENAVGTPGAPARTSGLEKVYAGLAREQDVFGDATFRGGLDWEYATYTSSLGGIFLGQEDIRQNAVVLRGHAAFNWPIGERLTLEPSLGTQFTDLRVDQPTLEPRLRLTIRPDGSDRQEISFATGIYKQIAEGIADRRDAGSVFTVWQLTSDDGDLLEARHYILGYQQEIGASLSASVEGYVKNMRNLPVPVWTPETRFNTNTVLADGQAYGVDARLEWARRAVYAFLGYSWARVEYEAANEDLGAWTEGAVVSYAPAHDRPHQVNAVFSYTWKGVTLSTSWQYGAGRPYTRVYGFDLVVDQPNAGRAGVNPIQSPGTPITLFDEPYNARLPDYHRLDVSLDRSFDLSPTTALETKVGALNVYDRDNIFYYDTNTLSRVNQSPVLPYASLRLLIN